MKDLILTDCDGVLLNWEFAFDCWMEDKGYKGIRKDDYDICIRYDITEPVASALIKEFNQSAAIGFLPPLRDAMHYVKKLHEEHGYVFRVITSLSANPYAQKLREKNLEKLFGTAIDSIICLDTGADKDAALEPYRNSGLYWIEDKAENAELGKSIGLTSLLMEHEHNMFNNKVPLVKNWYEIWNTIVNGD
jgi:hypothetical protein